MSGIDENRLWRRANVLLVEFYGGSVGGCAHSNDPDLRPHVGKRCFVIALPVWRCVEANRVIEVLGGIAVKAEASFAEAGEACALWLFRAREGETRLCFA